MSSIRESENAMVQLEALPNRHVLKWSFDLKYASWLIFRLFRLVAESAYELRIACPSVSTHQRGSHWTNFREV